MLTTVEKGLPHAQEEGLRPRTLHQGPRLHEDKKGQKLRVDTPAAAASWRMLQRSQATSDSIDATALRTLHCPTRNPLTHSRDPTNMHNDPLPQPHPRELPNRAADAPCNGFQNFAKPEFNRLYKLTPL